MWDVAGFNGKLSGAVPALVLKEGDMTAPSLSPRRNLLTRRSLFIGAATSLLCTPAIVRASNLMPVRRLPFPFGPQYAGFVERLHLHALERSLQKGLQSQRTSIELCGRTMPIDDAKRRVSVARAHGFLPPYVCIYRDD